MSQEQLAELVGVEPPSICNIENGKNYPTLQNLEKITDTLNVSFSEIFDFKHIKPNDELLDELNELLLMHPDKIVYAYKIIKDIL